MDRERRCIFCGGTEDLMPPGLMPDGSQMQDAPVMCRRCSRSLGDMSPADWFRWLRRNDPQHWAMLVDHHRFGKGELAHSIRRVRIED